MVEHDLPLVALFPLGFRVISSAGTSLSSARAAIPSVTQMHRVLRENELGFR